MTDNPTTTATTQTDGNTHDPGNPTPSNAAGQGDPGRRQPFGFPPRGGYTGGGTVTALWSTYDLATHKAVPKDAVVLDLRGIAASTVATHLRSGCKCSLMRMVADQIEPPKPPRIEEPGKYGVVRATGHGLADVEWVNEGRFWRSLSGDPSPRTSIWSHLSNPVLVREGVQS